MRTIKFRVWNSETEMYQDFEEALNVSLCSYSDTTFGLEATSNLAIEQYVGIKDCGNEEVFEGDVFHCEDEFYGRIVFKNGNFYVEEFDFQTPHLILETESIDNYTWDQVAILGTIHDNSRDFSQHF